MKSLKLIALLLIAICLVGFGGPTSDPKAQALKIMQVFHHEDWKGLYSVIAFSPQMKKHLETRDKFAADVANGIGSTSNGAIVHQLFSSMKNIRVGQATVHGNKASVPTFCTVTVNGNTKNFAGTANLAKDDGVWKLDLSTNEDLASQTSRAVQQLLGKPVG